MRIRQVRPEFFTDAVISQFPPDIRLSYIGLWCVADDAGWLRWDVGSIGAVLYPWETPRKRERHLTETGAVLVGAGRMLTYPCGCAEIPRLSFHQKIGGTKATTALDWHKKGHKWAARPDVRTLVMERDNYLCRYCGKGWRDGAFIILEHVENGGPTTMENCVAACSGCNRRKSNKTLAEVTMTLLPVPEGHLPDISEVSQIDTPGKVGNGRVSNVTVNGRASAQETTEYDKEALMAAYRRQGLPVDVA